MPLPPDPTDLMYFALVVNAGGFSEAAKQSGIPKSTLSRRIGELEARLGEKVLQRTTRRIVMTEMGQRILGAAEQIAQEAERVAEVAEHRQQTPSGRLRVSVPADLASIVLGPMLAAFSAAWPEVQLDLDLSPRYVDVIAEGYDLAIRVGEGDASQHLIARHLTDLDLGLYAAPAYLQRRGAPQGATDLARFELLALISAGAALPWPLSLRGRAVTVDMAGRRMGANSYDLLRRMVLTGAGIAVLPTLFAEDFQRQGRLVRLLPEWGLQPVTVRAVFPSRRLMPQKTRVFLDALLYHLRPGRPADPALIEAYSLMTGGPQRNGLL
ncbi:LysR family transcriptional regulator [Gemmobacter nectariphilus]|uniref:LysR family transcriptional regulator n=1 Tax=Gemmobacter nectariphilus TaxID=220343 RepID=UPI000408DF16|nr:LysR family transcriptional regulator [Gemmobacter nectariphilus]